MSYWTYQGCNIFNERERERKGGEKSEIFKYFLKKIQTFKNGHNYSILVKS